MVILECNSAFQCKESLFLLLKKKKKNSQIFDKPTSTLTLLSLFPVYFFPWFKFPSMVLKITPQISVFYLSHFKNTDNEIAMLLWKKTKEKGKEGRRKEIKGKRKGEKEEMQGTWHDSRPGSECFTTSSDQSPFFPCKCSGSIQEAFSHQGSITFGLALCGKQVI